jgi:hypothetical protein
MHTQALSRTGPTVALVLVGWLLVAIGAAAAGLVERYPLPLPTLVVILTVALLLAIRSSAALRTWIEAIGPVPLVALHVSRFVGAAFLVLAARGDLPAQWAIPTGWGDIAVAALAIPLLAWGAPFRTRAQRRALFAWNVLGLLDMLMVVGGAVRMIMTDPDAGTVMEHLPMSLLPTFLVPLILVSHVLIFVWLRREPPR